MKRRTRIFIIAIMLTGIACCLIYSRKDTAEAGSVVYQDLLAEYERALEDPFYTREKWGNDVYEWLDYYMDEECPVRYCIKDLNGDGREELIIGFVKHRTPFERFGTKYRDSYSCEPDIIYTYEDEDVRWSVVREAYIIKLYEGGIAELIESTDTVREYYMYYQAGEEYKKLDTLAIDWQDGQPAHYYKYIHDGDGRAIDREEVTEEEFHAVRNRYAATEEELEWEPIEGFWEPEDALSLYDLEQILKGNILEVIRKLLK